MSNEVLEKVKQLPADQQEKIEALVDRLLNQRQYPGSQMSQQLSGDALAEKRRRLVEREREGKTFWMADDFNDTPEDFKDYM